MASSRLPSIGPFNLGVNNRRPEFDLRTKEGTFLRAGVNVDISSTGSVKRRRGYEQIVSGVDCHSLFAGAAAAYFVDGTDLKKVVNLDTSPATTTLKTDMSAGRHVSYAEVGDSVYFSNGVTIGRIDAAGAHSLGCPSLVSEPVAAYAAGGSLPPGTYRLCFAFTNAAGEQSGTTFPITVTLVNTGAIAVSGMPESFPPGVVGLLIYATPLNSDALLHVMTVNVPTPTITLPILSYGGRCQTLMLTSMPAGDIVRELNGRLFTAVGNALFYSEPYAYALTNPERNYVVFDAPITVVEAVDNGLYVVADQAYWIAGDIADAELSPVLPYGAVPGSSGQVPNENKCWWMSTRGVVIGDQSGQVRNLQDDSVVIDKAGAGAGLFRETDGIKQVLTSLFSSSPSGAAARSYMDAEIVRKGTTL